MKTSMAPFYACGMALLALACTGITASASLDSLKESLQTEITPEKLLKQVGWSCMVYTTPSAWDTACV